MPNIPGISGYTQPGVFARDRVVSTGVSIPGGVRIPCIMGEGLREELLIASAAGAGADGNPSISPTGGGDGRFFQLSLAPVASGRTELYLNGGILYGTEGSTRTDGTWDSDGFSGEFDYRVDPDTGAIELQGASIGDQDGLDYSPSSTNTGDAVIYDASPGGWDLISVVDDNAVGEIWTIRCVGVTRDSNGDPIPGLATFTASGSASGMLRNSSGQPYLWNTSAFTSSLAAVSGTLDIDTDGFIVAEGDASGVLLPQGSPVERTAGDEQTDEFAIGLGDLPAQGQALVGDYLIVPGENPIEITDISFDGTDTTITLATATLSVNAEALTSWEIKAINLLIDDPTETHNPITGDLGAGHAGTEGDFTSSDVGKVILISDNDAAGLYYITHVTSSRRVRLASFEDTSVGLPAVAAGDAAGLMSGEGVTTFHMLQTNGVLLFGLRFGAIPAEVGDKYYIRINSKVLEQGDSLEVRYVHEGDLDDPEYFTSAKQLFQKHGTPSLTNTLSLGAQMAFENGAPAILALQCRPPLPRRTNRVILEEQSDNVGGFSGGDESDDLFFPIPRPVSGLRNGRPDTDTQVNIFIIRNGEETQIFPNKVGFYNSQYQNDVGIRNFVTGADTTYSYTIVDTQREIIASGDAGEVSAATSEFSTLEVDFDADDIVDGAVIVVQSLVDAGGNVISTLAGIGTALFGDPLLGAELTITGIEDDNTVTVVATDGATVINAAASDIQFYIYDVGNDSDLSAALLLNNDFVENGVLQQGDGLRMSYIDQQDADYFDVNWFNGFEALESADCQMVVPLPTQNRFGIFRAAVNHCENMSTIAIQKERIAFFGAQQGVSAESLVGYEELAVEDIGVLEGIQGDDPEEVLDGNVEDLVNLKLSDNYTSSRAVYFFPDRIVRNVAGTNTYIDGFYIAAAATGWLAAMQNVAIPLTYKSLSGFSIIRDRKYTKTMENLIGNVGATLLTPVTGGGKVLHARTTSNSGFVEDEELSVMFIRDRVKHILRESLKGFLGTVENPNTQGLITARVINLLAGLVSQGLITSFANTRVERDKVDPRQWNVYTRFQPSYPINYIFIDIEVGVI